MKKQLYLLFMLLLIGATTTKAQTWSHYSSPSDLVVNDVKDICKDQFGNLYVTTCYPEGWELYCDMPKWNSTLDEWTDTVRGEGAHIDNSFFNDADNQGNFWLVTGNGVFQYDGVDYGYAAGLPKSDHLPLEMSTDKNGTLWYAGVSTGGSFYTGSLIDGSWSDFSEKFNTDPLDFLQTSPKGTTWAYSTDNLVNITDNLQQYSIDLGGRFPFTCIFDSLDRPILVVPNFSGGVENNLLLFDDGILKPLDYSGLGSGFYQHAIRATDNTIYVASLGQGMRLVDDEKVTTYTEADGLPSDTVLHIMEDSEGLIWLATAEGVATLSNGVVTAITTIEGISDIRVQEILEMERGDLWFATNKGLFRYEWLFEGVPSSKDPLNTSATYLPSSLQLQLRSAINASMVYQIIDVQGRTVAEGSFVQRKDVPVSYLEKGVYMVRFSLGDRQQSQRVLVH